MILISSLSQVAKDLARICHIAGFRGSLRRRWGGLRPAETVGASSGAMSRSRYHNAIRGLAATERQGRMNDRSRRKTELARERES